MHKLIATCLTVVAVLLAMLSSPTVAQAQQQPAPLPREGAMPSVVPTAKTPAVDDGDVRSIAKVGGTMVIGGNFTSVEGQARSRIAAFDATSGALASFAPNVNGEVSALAPGPTANTVYVGGSFTEINGTAIRGRLALLNLNNGQVDSSFTAAALNFGAVRDFVRVGDRIITVGTFTKVGGTTHGGIAALNATTGAAQHSYMGVDLTGHHNDTGSGAQGPVGPWNIDVTPQGDRVAIVGNFKYADGALHDQVAQIDLGANSASVSNWQTNRYSPYCYNWAFDSYVRGVSYSPDGSYFVVTATGGGVRDTLCDAAARFETRASGSALDPTWVSESGGDTTWAVEVTDSAVFVGGHQRWGNNPYGVDRAGAGAVPRPGLFTLDPISGRPLSWNPGRNPPGKAVYSLLSTSEGLWMGSNTRWVGNRQYLRDRIAMFPYNGGSTVASTKTGDIPGTILWGGAQGSQSSLSQARLNGDSVIPASALANTGVDWSRVRAAMMVGPTVFTAETDGYLHARSFDGTAFGPDTRIDPYHDPVWKDVDNNLGGTFDGNLPSLYGQLGTLTGMFYSDGKLYYARSGQSALQARWFSPDSGIVDERTFSVTGMDFSQTRGLFVAAGKLFFVKSDGSLWRTDWQNGAPSGSPVQVSSPQSGDPNLTNRAFFLSTGKPINQAPTAEFTSSCTDASCNFDATASSDADGEVSDYVWDFGDGSQGTSATAEHTYVESGTYQVTLTVSDNDGSTASVTKQVEVQAPVNQDPVADFGSSCTDAVCQFDGRTSTDPDGEIATYEWDFGDGEVGDGAQPNHTYTASGSYAVKLTVTDNRGGQSSKTRQVDVTVPSGSVDFVDSSASNLGGKKKRLVDIPTAAAEGDVALLYFTHPDAADYSGPLGVTGWTQVGEQSSGGVVSTVWRKRLAAGDAGATVSFESSATRLGTAQIAVYRGVGPGPLTVAADSGSNVTEHNTPAVGVQPGDLVVRFVGTKSSQSMTWSLPSGLVERGLVSDTAAYPFDSVLTDLGTTEPAEATAPAMKITSSAPASQAIWWSIALPSE